MPDAPPPRRLIAAIERLDPAGRALLNIWIHQDLDDEKIARMSHIPEGRLEERRQVIVEELASELGSSPAEVRQTIERLAHPGPPPQTSRRPGRRRVMIGVVAILVLAAAAGTVAAVRSNGPSRSKRSATAVRSAAPAPAAKPLTPLTGGPPGASGTAAISGPPAHARLRISVAGLPAPGAGHYEAWLYNSIIDCTPLGIVVPGAAPLQVALPAQYARYRYLDISLQPPGPNPNHSGQSVLRVLTPQAG